MSRWRVAGVDGAVAIVRFPESHGNTIHPHKREFFSFVGGGLRGLTAASRRDVVSRYSPRTPARLTPPPKHVRFTPQLAY